KEEALRNKANMEGLIEEDDDDESRYEQRRRRIRVCTHQRPRRKQAQYTVSREDQYAVLKILYVKILEDIKCGPYSKKSPIRRIQPLGYAVSNRFPDSINRKLKNEF
ncbi:hypothetical protein Tco_0198095, partial [Tanacetum coccineum]